MCVHRLSILGQIVEKIGNENSSNKQLTEWAISKNFPILIC